MFGKQKRGNVPPTTVRIPTPRRIRRGGMETLMVFVEKCAGRPLASWESDVLETLVKEAAESEAMHG